MRDEGIGRLLVASLHQAISDEIPTRLDFYEHWLDQRGLRHGVNRRAPMLAIVGFLRTEGEAFHRITARAGAYAAEWLLASKPPLLLTASLALPAPVAARVALRLARQLVRRTSSSSRARVRLRRGQGTFTIHGSVFCDVREPAEHPLCDFYAAAATRFLELHRLEGEVRATRCRATGAPACVLAVAVRGRRPAESLGRLVR